MRMMVEYLVGAAGAIKPPQELTIYNDVAVIYRKVADEYRYVVGWSNDEPEQLVVLDLYLTQLTSEHPFVVPHFIEKYEDIDQAVAALTIGYDQTTDLVKRLARSTKNNWNKDKIT